MGYTKYVVGALALAGGYLGVTGVYKPHPELGVYTSVMCNVQTAMTYVLDFTENASDASVIRTQSLLNFVESTSVKSIGVPPAHNEVDLEANGVPVRVYYPDTASKDTPVPVVVFYHGGGFVIFDGVNSHSYVPRQLVDQTGAVVVSVNYRSGPQHRFPAALDDSAEVLRWVQANQKTDALPVDASRLAVIGDSAGGNIVVQMSRLSALKEVPEISLAVSAYPWLNVPMKERFPSYKKYESGLFLTHQVLSWFGRNYIGELTPEQDADVRLRPLKWSKEQLEGFPAQVVIQAELDILYDEGQQYVGMLKDAGVPVQNSVYKACIHTFFGHPYHINGVEALQEAGRAINKAFAQ